MSRLPITLQSQLSPETEIKYQRVAKAGSGLAATFQALFAKKLPRVEDAKEFVESFSPWELFGVRDVTVDSEARPLLD